MEFRQIPLSQTFDFKLKLQTVFVIIFFISLGLQCLIWSLITGVAMTL